MQIRRPTAGKSKKRRQVENGLTEDEFAHILKTFPLVPEPVRAAALDAYRDVGKGKVK